MTTIEQFNRDIAFNSKNVLFTMTDDEEMGQRGQGVYVKDIIEDGNECRNFIFDNGHHYVFDNVEEMIYLCEPISEDYFIHKFLEKVVSDFIDKWSIVDSDGKMVINCSNDEVEAPALIRLLPYREEKVVYLTNIMIPIHLKHKGLGRLLIRQVFDICQRLKYRLILPDVVESFSRSLEKRNAKFLDFDTVEITVETNLN